MSNWHADGNPEVKHGNEGIFIVAVRRARNGKIYTFPALYLNDFPLNFDEGYECICADKSKHTDDGCPVTGWFDARSSEDGPVYDRLKFAEGDEMLGWTDIPLYDGSKI